MWNSQYLTYMNNPLRCLVLDDEPMALEKMQAYISRVPYLSLVALCESPVEALPLVGEADVIFTDINMPDINGLDFLASLDNPPLAVFTTAYGEYAVEGFRLQAIDYLLKPFDFESFSRAAERVRAQYELLHPASKELLYVKVDYRHVPIELDNILYIKGMSEYVQICLREGKPLMVHGGMQQMAERLPQQFLQVHRSYIVNMYLVREVARGVVRMTDGTEIPISDTYRQSVAEFLQKHRI